MLACIALKAAPATLARDRIIAEAKLAPLQSFVIRHKALFDRYPPEDGMVCYLRCEGLTGARPSWNA